MKSIKVVSFVAIAMSHVATCQTVTNGSARSVGACSVSHSGNGDTYVISSCGIGEAQGKQIIALLKAALKSNDVSAKLDELLKLAQQPVSTGIVQGNSGGLNILQGTTGPGSPIVNSPINVGAFPIKIPSSDRPKYKEFLQYPPNKWKVIIEADQFSGASTLPDDFYELVKDAGWNMAEAGVSRPMMLSAPGKRFQGVTLEINGEPVPPGEKVYPTPTDPWPYLAQTLLNLGLAVQIEKLLTHPEGTVTVRFTGGFPNRTTP